MQDANSILPRLQDYTQTAYPTRYALLDGVHPITTTTDNHNSPLAILHPRANWPADRRWLKVRGDPPTTQGGSAVPRSSRPPCCKQSTGGQGRQK
ncbi:hypothetical protein FIBSPDRAFT_859136 [Athelia psychrophila]|uniref:Uncharacterized protein n=1 Tax=Athelia psychrophila TaxID=1759441 RepID=A0A166LGB8_9AGAM|nr:hypothetical protein FIBSPDRAFT_859136 [Fibularhizoctonia sp. CBS 109695]